MYHITLICTAHLEIGNCNSRELYRIIEGINPEIIFEELSLAVFNECYGIQNRITLETSAIKKYLQNHNIEHIPVVSTELPKDLDEKFKIMITDKTYCNLIDNLMSMEEKYCNYNNLIILIFHLIHVSVSSRSRNSDFNTKIYEK